MGNGRRSQDRKLDLLISGEVVGERESLAAINREQVARGDGHPLRRKKGQQLAHGIQVNRLRFACKQLGYGLTAQARSVRNFCVFVPAMILALKCL